jgi:predicted SprT family Zn-dependent metalloprotease
LRAIRFGAYRRHGTPTIFVNPRLDRPWVARAFVEHVLHHELCHHAQHCQPVRGERPHSPRFHAWESTYPLHREAIAWQRHYLSHLLE